MAKKNDNSGMNERLIGAAIPVSALRTEKSIGVGEFSDLVEFGELSLEMGVKLVQILPVNDTGYDSSPYAALTAFGLHPLYLRIGDLDETNNVEAGKYNNEIDALGKKFSDAIRYPYEEILRDKILLLRKIYDDNKKKIIDSPGLKKWIDENPWVKAYAIFRNQKEAHEERSWKEWTSNRDIAASGIDALWVDKDLREKHLFWVWVQQALDLQFSAAVAGLQKMGIILEGDLPILMNEDSCDVWANREIFHLELSAGAPPDMYSYAGQNWGFPIYNWQKQAEDNYSWWKARLKAAEKYYQAYRIDHVLGFFRIWATRREDNSALMGRYIPSAPVTLKDLEKLGFDKGRIRWVSQPHIFTGELWDALKAGWNGSYNEDELKAAADRVFDLALDRIGKEELWLFSKKINGEKDIEALDIHSAAKSFLLKEWGNRIFLEYEKGKFFPLWYHSQSRAYESLSSGEKEEIKELLEKLNLESEKVWEKEGRELLSILTSSSAMLPCAEDLGAVPACVPKVLKELNILGLRVVRWHREWARSGEPYVPFDEYPELSVCTPAVHDSSCLREWWDREANQEVFCDFLGIPSLPKVYNPGTAKIILKRIAASASRFRVFQIQDLLHLSNNWYASDPGSERINVPGTADKFNWTYRLPANISRIKEDGELIRAVKDLC